VGRLFYALFLQWRFLDDRPEEKDQRATACVPVTTKPEPVDRYIRVASRDDSGSGVVRMVQPVRVESFRQAEIQEFWVNIFVYFWAVSYNIESNNNCYSCSQYALGVVGDVGTAVRRSRQL